MENISKKIIFYIIFTFFSSSKGIITNNIIRIIKDKKYPIVLFNSNKNYINIISSNKVFIFDKKINLVENKTITTYSPPYFLCIDQSNNYFLAEKMNYYSISINLQFKVSGTNSLQNLPVDFLSLGYIQASSFDKSAKIVLARCNLNENEIIIYGKLNSYIYFYFVSKQQVYNENIDELGSFISCKLIKDVKYICAYRKGVYVNLGAFVHLYISLKKEGISKVEEKKIVAFKNYDNPVIYDLSGNTKIICALNTSLYIKCIKAEIEDKNFYSYIENINIENDYYYNYINNFSFNIGNCYFISFLSEYLLCCTNINVISCKRLNNKYILINSFEISKIGKNSNLTIITNIDNATLFFMNENSGEYHIYQYTIYPPKCSVITKKISVFQNFGLNLYDYLEYKGGNVKYFLELTSYPSNFGYIKLNGTKLNLNEKRELNNIENNFQFFSENNKTTSKVDIIYSISIEATYSVLCKISLEIVPCHRTCKYCSGIIHSEEHHNCVECKNEQGFYHFPSETDYNCYTKEEVDEKYPNWYLNESKKEFEQCHYTCQKCNGAIDENCLSCKDNKLLYNGKCLDNCPLGTFKINSENNKCMDCYKNCESCKELGNSSTMMCNSCFQGDVMYKGYYKNSMYLYNCYKVSDNIIKSFFVPESLTEISNCFELFGKYIIENTNECIDLPKENNQGQNYFVSNKQTGLLSPCDSSCLTCSQNFTKDNPNCDSCKNGLLQDGKCLTKCDDGYYKNNAKCLKCHKNCQTCSTGILTNSEGKIINMKCTQCKIDKKISNILRYLQGVGEIYDGINLNIFRMIKNDENCFPIIIHDNNKITFNISEIDPDYDIGNCLKFDKAIFQGEYECISKPPHTFYVLENNENTGVIKNCSESCDSCVFEETNCIICSLGYYKTEDSNNKCLLQKSIQPNYYRNESDDIYYKCYSTCYNCTNKYDNKSKNMNCISCINDHYFIYGEENKNCYNISLINQGYYLDIYDLSTEPKFKKCYNNCKTCNKSYSENGEMNCIQCKEGYYKLNGTNNCYNEEEINENSLSIIKDSTLMIIDIKESNNKIVKTTSNIIEVSNDNKFIISHMIEHSISLEFSLPNTNDALYDKINETIITSENIKYIISTSYSETNNEPNKFIINSFNQNTSLLEFKSIIKTNITTFVNSSKLINGSDFIAIISNSDEINPSTQLEKGISAIDLGNCTKEMKIHYNIPEDESLIVLNIELKRNKSIDNEINNDKSFDLGKKSQIEIYDISGNKLNLSVCKEDIKVMKYIKDVEELDIKSAMNLAEKGVDVFNASDEFFNNICYNFNNNGTDIIIKDRRSDIYKNVSFCQDGCSYIGMNYELMTANCICYSNSIQTSLENSIDNDEKHSNEEKLSFKNLKESFISSLFPFNIKVIYCYNLVFNLKILKKNIGFFCLLVMLLFQIIFYFIYQVKKLKSLRYFMLIFNNKKFSTKKSFPPHKSNKKNNSIINKYIQNKKKIQHYLKSDKENRVAIEEKSNNEININNNRLFSLENDIKNIFENKNMDLFNINSINFSKKGKKSLIISNNFEPKINIQSSIFNINNKISVSKLKNNKTNNLKKTNEFILDNEINNNKNINSIKTNDKLFLKNSKVIKNNKRILNRNDNKKDLSNFETKGGKSIVKNKIEKNIFKLFKTDEDFQDMDYEQAIIYDKRSYLRMYWAFLVDTQIILGTFCTENYLDLLVIKLSFFVYTFQISLFLNALFYVDDYISEAYHNNGILDFFSGLPKSIYSFFATLVTTNLLRILSNSKNELTKLIKEKRKYKNYIYLINIKLRKLRKKLIVYFILVFLLGFLFLYYVSAFCAVYRYSQKYWLIGCLESFGMDSLVSIIICIFLALFRYIAIKSKLKCFYILANIISTFL